MFYLRKENRLACFVTSKWKAEMDTGWGEGGWEVLAVDKLGKYRSFWCKTRFLLERKRWTTTHLSFSKVFSTVWGWDIIFQGHA